jgi:hypothetical protein
VEINLTKTLEIPQFEPLPLIESMTKSQYDKEHGIEGGQELNDLAIEDEGDKSLENDAEQGKNDCKDSDQGNFDFIIIQR